MTYLAGIQISIPEIIWYEPRLVPIQVQVQDWFSCVLCFKKRSLHKSSWIERCLFLAYFLLFRRQRSEVCMEVLITFSESLGAHDSNEPFLDDI
jgi:hypothetical protein